MSASCTRSTSLQAFTIEVPAPEQDRGRERRVRASKCLTADGTGVSGRDEVAGDQPLLHEREAFDEDVHGVRARDGRWVWLVTCVSAVSMSRRSSPHPVVIDGRQSRRRKEVARRGTAQDRGGIPGMVNGRPEESLIDSCLDSRGKLPGTISFTVPTGHTPEGRLRRYPGR